MIAFSLCLLLGGAQSLCAQTIWSPCGCGDQPECNGCQAAGSGWGHWGHGACGCGTAGCGGVGCGAAGHWRDPNYFTEWQLRPFGVYNEHILGLQRRNGVAAQMVFYSYDFAQNSADGSWRMSAIGAKDAQKIGRMWPVAQGTILVEPTGDAQWDAARRQAAYDALVANGVSCSIDDVVVGSSHIQGLVPLDPEIIYYQRQQPSPYMRGFAGSMSVGSSSVGDGSADSGGFGSNAGTGTNWGNSGTGNQN
jgi:hypothetical protein